MAVFQFGGVGRIIRDGEDMRAVYAEGQRVWPWMPQDLFADGARGVLYDFTDKDTLYQDDAGTVPVTAANNPIGLVKDLSGNGFDMYQPVSTARGEYKDDVVGRVQLDKIDDDYSIDFTGTGGFEATWYQGGKEGLIVGKLSIPNGVWSLATNPRYFPSNNVMGMIIVEGVVSESMDAAIRQWFADRGCGMDFGAMTSFQHAFRARTDVIALDCAHWDTSSVTRFDYFAYLCSSLVTLDTSSWDTSSVTSFRLFAYSSPALTTVLVAPGKSFSAITSGDLGSAFQGTNLTQESIDNILVNLETCAVNNGVFGQSGGSAPSAIGEAAIDALRLRGWIINVTGGY